jgi:steroid 5-alpha reductase family enzyme
MNPADVFLLTFFAAMTMMTMVWVESLIRSDASVVDAFWPLGFVLVAVCSYFAADGYEGRRLLTTVLVVIWGLRLALHIGLRNHGKPEDYRYAAQRRRFKGFPALSLFIVFWLQGILLWLVSLVYQLAHLADGPAHFTLLDGIGLALWCTGFFFEAVGDYQLKQFKKDPANKGKPMDKGLWAWTRHPNYFGESLIWWGMWCFAASTEYRWWALFSPLLMTFLLIKVSGVRLLDNALRERGPEYREYMERVPAFFPRPPRKRTIQENTA